MLHKYSPLFKVFAISLLDGMETPKFLSELLGWYCETQIKVLMSVNQGFANKNFKEGGLICNTLLLFSTNYFKFCLNKPVRNILIHTSLSYPIIYSYIMIGCGLTLPHYNFWQFWKIPNSMVWCFAEFLEGRILGSRIWGIFG